MNCRSSEEYMMKYFDGDGNDIENVQFKQHIKSCSKCSGQFKELGEVFSFLERSGTVEPPEDFEVRVMDRIRAMEKVRKARAEKGVNILYNVLTALSIAFLLIFVTGTADMSIEQLLALGGGFLEAFSGKLAVVSSALIAIADIAAGIGGVFLQTCFILIKSYYYIFVTLLAMLLAVQKMFYVLVEQGRES